MAEIAPALGQTLEAAQGAAIRAEANRERASPLVGAGAAMSGWATSDAYRWITKPDFGPADPNFDAQTSINQVPFQLSDDDREFLLKSTNSESWQYNLKAIQDQRERYKAMGDSPITSFMVGMIDPVYLAADAASFGAARFVTAGRAAKAAVGATGAAATSLAISGISSEVRPVGTQEIILDALFNAGATGLAAGFAGKLSKVDNDFQGDMYQSTLQKPAPAGITGSLDNAVAVADDQARTMSEKFADGLAWSVHSSLSKYDSALADRLVSNIRSKSVSAEDEIFGIRRELSTAQFEFEDLLKGALAERGAGLLARIFKKDATKIQRDLENEVAMEMWRRESLVNRGLEVTPANVNPRVTAIADALDKVNALAADTLRKSGVEGAEQIVPRSGWFSRSWNASKYNDVVEALTRSGKTMQEAEKMVKGLVTRSLRLANADMPDEIAKDIAASTINRMKRKGEHADPIFFTRKDSAEYNAFRDIMREEGVPEERITRALDYLTGAKAEKGKAAFLKHRVDLDYRAALDVNGQLFRVVDMFDTGLTTITERYLDGVAGKAGFARAGMNSEKAIQQFRDELVQKMRAKVSDPNAIAREEKLIDNTIQHLQGKPAGEEMSQIVRLGQSWARSVALSASGLWQVTEYAPAMAHYGAIKTLKYAMQELPVLRKLFTEISENAGTSTKLKDILARSAYQDTRIRPFIQRFEDGFAIPESEMALMKMQQASQLVPYFNAMKYVQHHQSRVTANLVIDRISDAVKGDAKAFKNLEKYGLSKDIMESLRSDITKYGLDTAKWTDGTWEAVRPVFIKMMDESVLKSRLGETPAFAAFDNIGKFLFSFRSFTLSAHNKILAGTAGRDGFGPLALIMMWQFPLAMIATQANEVSRGREPLAMDKLAAKAVGQVGSLGLLSEVAKVFTGESRQWGSPGLIALDRSINFLGTGAAAIKAEMNGDDANWGKVGAAAMAVTPVLGMAPLSGALQTLLKTD